jgi:predicted exporter
MSTPGRLQVAYDFLKGRKALLYGVLAVFLLLCLAIFLTAPIRTDIQVMLPRGEGDRLVKDFALLTESGLSSNVFISVHTEGDATKDDLVAAARLIEKELPTDMVTLMDARSINPLKIMDFILTNAPNLMTDADRQQMRAYMEPASIEKQLKDAKRELATPQGIALKKAIRKDPLGLRYILFPRLKSFQSLSQATVSGGYLFSADQRAIMLTGRSNLSITDAENAARLIDAFDSIRTRLPENTSAELISGLVHTNANASTIKRDILIISLVSLCALGLVFLVFFRTLRVAGVFIAPLIALAAALGGMALFHREVSAIVIGFGSVLIGISIDFSMHVYYGIAKHKGAPGEAVQATFKPILFCTLTSCAAFGALYLSGMPGINQLATFSISGLVIAAIFALIVLPHMSSNASVVNKSTPAKKSAQHPLAALAIFACLLLAALWFGSSIKLDPDLRSIGYVPEEVRQAEQTFNDTWGDVRNNAVIFAKGDSLDQALIRNEQVYTTIRAELPEGKPVSLTPLMPSLKSQSANRKAWQAIWTEDVRQQTLSDIHAAGKPLGFSAKAFTPFERGLNTNPGDITPESLHAASLGFLTNLLMPHSQDAKATILTLIPDSEMVQSVFSPEKEQELGVRLVSNSRLKHTLEIAMRDDIKYFITVSGLAAALLVILLFRNMRRSALAMLPAGLGLAMVFGILSAANTPLNLFHITALPLIIGLGMDYGIFLVNHEVQEVELATLPAVRASGLTTLASFGILILGKHPSLHSLGITVVVGVGTALLCALYLMPHLLRKRP